MTTFPTAAIAFRGHTTIVPCEVITDTIAVTPYLDLNGDTPQLGGGFAITHTPSGYTITPGQACIECAREAARMLAAIPLDWPALSPADADLLQHQVGDHMKDVQAAIRLFRQCSQSTCFHDGSGKEFICDICVGRGGDHASHCIHAVLPMVAEHNAQVEAARAAR